MHGYGFNFLTKVRPTVPTPILHDYTILGIHVTVFLLKFQFMIFMTLSLFQTAALLMSSKTAITAKLGQLIIKEIMLSLGYPQIDHDGKRIHHYL